MYTGRRSRGSLQKEDDRNERDWKHINQNYDHHYEGKISQASHRGDLASTTRLLGYTDAMMATCATFLVIPIKHLETLTEAAGGETQQETLSQFLDSTKLEIVMFFLGFLIVCTIWESVNIRTIVIKRLDDFLVLTSILSMLVTTVLPFAIALQGHFPGDEVSIICTTIFLLLIEILEIVMVLYAFASPNLLHIEMKNWQPKNVKRIRNALLQKSVVNIILITAAALFGLIDYRISWAMLSIVVLNPLLRKLYFYLRRKYSKECDSEHSEFYWFLSKGNIPKERVEAFTDAATAIIACVLILDITIEEFPRLDKVKEGELFKEIKHMRHELYTFFGAYILVSLLWYVNHTILHLYHTIDVLTLYTQKIFLCFLSLMPLCSNLLTNFTFKGHDNPDENLAIRVAAILTLLSSSCNSVMAMWGFYKKEKVLYQWALNNKTKRDQDNHIYIIMKAANMPFWSFVVLIGSFARADYALNILIVCFVLMVCCFMGMKFLFVNHIGKAITNRFSTRRRQNISRRSHHLQRPQSISDQWSNGNAVDHQSVKENKYTEISTPMEAINNEKLDEQ